MTYFAGLVGGLNETALCVVDEAGSIVREGRAGSEPDALVTWLATAGVELPRIGFEAGPLSPRLHEGLRAASLPAVCLETRRMKGAGA